MAMFEAEHVDPQDISTWLLGQMNFMEPVRGWLALSRKAQAVVEVANLSREIRARNWIGALYVTQRLDPEFEVMASQGGTRIRDCVAQWRALKDVLTVCDRFGYDRDLLAMALSRNDGEAKMVRLSDPMMYWESETEVYSYDDDTNRWSWVMLSYALEFTGERDDWTGQKRTPTVLMRVWERWEDGEANPSEGGHETVDLFDFGNPAPLDVRLHSLNAGVEAEQQERYWAYIQWVVETGKHPLGCAFELPEYLDWKDKAQRSQVREWVRRNVLVNQPEGVRV